VKRGAASRISPRAIWKVLERTADSWLRHEGLRLAASLSLYSLLSLAPLVILSIAIASLAVGRSAAQNALINEVTGAMGPAGATAVETIIEYGKTPRVNGAAALIGTLVLLFGASSVFGELQSALNKIWEVESARISGFRALIRSRLFSFAMVLAFGFLLLVSLLFSAALVGLGGYLSAHLALPKALLHAIDALISFVATSFLIALILKYVPDVPIRWRDVWHGAIATALLFTIGKTLLGLYLGKAAVGSAYGAAGSLVVVIVWVYYSAMIFYFGAEFTHMQARGSEGPRGPP
jgi:membrane protein